MDLKPHIEKFRQRFAEVEALLSDPKTFANNQKFQELSREYARLKELVAVGNAYLKVERDLADNRALLASEAGRAARAAVAQQRSEKAPRVFRICIRTLRCLTFEVRGGHKWAKPACGRPLD